MLTEKERLWAHSTRAHHMAALSYSGYGDKVKAMEHAKLAIEEDMIKGSRNDWEEHAVRELIEKSPENCDSWKRKHRLDDVRKRVARQNRSKI